MARQHEHVFTPLTQSGQAQANHVEAVVQVFAKTALFYPLLQILMRRRDDAHIGLDGVVPADPVKMAVAQYPEQPGLKIKRHVADFIEEKCAAVGLLKTAAPQRLRAGKGATLMAEELAFQQIFRNGGGVDRNEGPVGARRMLVQRARHQLFART